MFRDEIVPWLNGWPPQDDDDDDEVLDLSDLFGSDDVNEGVTSGADLGEENGPPGFVDTIRDNASDREIDASQYKREDLDLPGYRGEGSQGQNSQGNRDDTGQGNRDDNGQPQGSQGNRDDNGQGNRDDNGQPQGGQGNRDDTGNTAGKPDG